MDKVAMECLNCGYVNVLRLKHSDGKRCLHCGGRIVFIGKAITEDERIVSIQLELNEVKKLRKALESCLELEKATKRTNRIPR